jgi:hypothetical protein
MKRSGIPGLASMVLVSCLMLLAADVPSYADFAYPDFQSTSGLNMVGSAAQYGDKIRLTPATTNTRGTIWTQQQQSVGGGFTTSFAFQSTGVGGGRDANGNIGVWQVNYLVQNTANNILQITDYDVTHPRLRVVIDGWRDAGTWGSDPSSSWVGVMLNGVTLAAVDVESRGIIFRDQAVHQATITYAEHTFKVMVDNQEVVSLTGVDLNAAGLGSGYAGFESYTGVGNWANNDLLNWSYQSVPEPMTVAFLGLGGVLMRRRLA